MKEFNQRFLAILLSILFFGSYAMAKGDYGIVPIDVQAKLLLKILTFNNSLNNGGDVTIHVMNSPEFAAEIKKSIGISVGKSKLSAVSEDANLPSLKPSVVYIGDSTKAGAVMNYTRSNKILSMTGLPDLVADGITLGVGVLDGKPKILVNISASKEENINWNPAILKISTTIK